MVKALDFVVSLKVAGSVSVVFRVRRKTEVPRSMYVAIYAYLTEPKHVIRQLPWQLDVEIPPA